MIVTRPAAAGETLCAHLEKMGFEAVHAPAFRLAPAPDPARARSDLQSALPADRVLFTSPASVEFALQLVDAGSFGGACILAPGAGTGRELERSGLHARWPESGGTSEDLLQLPELGDVQGLRCLILAAPGGRDLIARTLGQRGAEVVRCEVYRREAQPPAREWTRLLDRGEPTATLISSKAALKQLASSLSPEQRDAWFRGQFVVSSPRLAEACRDLGVNRIVAAESAGNEAMLSALERALGEAVEDSVASESVQHSSERQ